MIETGYLITVIYILFYALIGMTIIAIAVIIALAIITAIANRQKNGHICKLSRVRCVKTITW